MYKIFFRIMWNNKKTYLLTVLSELCIIVLIYDSLIISSGLIYVSTGRISTLSSLIFKAEETFLVPYILLMIFQIFILLDYIRKRIADYALLTALGMERKHKYLFVVAEYVSIIIGSILCGFLVGSIVSVLFQNILEYIFRDVTDKILYGWAALELLLIVCFILFGIGFMICDQILSCFGLEYVASNGKKQGKPIRVSPVFRFTSIIMVILAVVIIITNWGQSEYLIASILACGALFFGLRTLMGAYFQRLQNDKSKYYCKILWLDDWYCQFYRHINKAFIPAAFLVVLVFGFYIQIQDNLPVNQTENFPYDLVWFANDGDQEFLDDLQDEYGIEYSTIPCIRVTTGDHGEHMGISAAEYHKWTGNHINLTGKEIYVIYQRDRSEKGMTGLSQGNKTPDIYIGNADFDLWIPQIWMHPNNKFTREYRIVGTTDKILTGNFKTRTSNENLKSSVFEEIIVFSDTEFSRIQDQARGANLAVTMNIPSNYEKVTQNIYTYAKEHSQINFFDDYSENLIYTKNPLAIEDRQNKIFQLTSSVISAVIVLVCIIFVLIQEIENDYSNRSWKYQFYYRLGMEKKRRHQILVDEIWMTGKVAAIFGAPIAILLTITKIVCKKMSSKWFTLYFFGMAESVILICVIVFIIMKIVIHQIYKKLEVEVEGE